MRPLPDRDGSGVPVNARVIALGARSGARWALAGDQFFVDLDLAKENLPAGTRLAMGSAIIEVTGVSAPWLQEVHGPVRARSDEVRELAAREGALPSRHQREGRAGRSGQHRGPDPTREVKSSWTGPSNSHFGLRTAPCRGCRRQSSACNARKPVAPPRAATPGSQNENCWDRTERIRSTRCPALRRRDLVRVTVQAGGLSSADPTQRTYPSGSRRARSSGTRSAPDPSTRDATRQRAQRRTVARPSAIHWSIPPSTLNTFS